MVMAMVQVSPLPAFKMYTRIKILGGFESEMLIVSGHFENGGHFCCERNV